jgi:TolA-binding protein
MEDSLQKSQPRPKDLLPNEQEVSFDRVHDFFNRYRALIAVFSVGLILAAVGFTAWQMQEDKRVEQARARFAAARSTEALQSVVQDFPSTEAALLANMALGDLYFQQSQWDKATASYQRVIDQFPGSVLTPSAEMGIAAIAEATDKAAEALKKYKNVALFFPKSFQAPQAQFAAGLLLEGDGKYQEARECYEDVVNRHSKSAWKNEAMSRLQKIDLILKNKSVPKT